MLWERASDRHAGQPSVVRVKQEKELTTRNWQPDPSADYAAASLGTPAPGIEYRAPNIQRLTPSIGAPASDIQQALQDARARLHAITDSPQLEAEVLLAHALGTSRTSVITHPEQILTRAQLSNYRSLIRDRASAYPLPYLIGRVEFYGLQFEVTPDVLIPRPETETLVDLALAHQPATVVDVGTGSGCIAVALAVHLPEVTVRAVEISPAALAIARRNVERHGVADRVQLMVGDVLTPRPELVGLIVSNPPYIPTGQCASLPASVRDHEPRLALDGGPEGLAITRRLLAQSPAVLHATGQAQEGERRPGGAILIEIGADQGEAAGRLARTFFPQATVRVHRDLAGRDRVLEVQL
jgi:release factor glutamine methyltransferase